MGKFGKYRLRILEIKTDRFYTQVQNYIFFIVVTKNWLYSALLSYTVLPGVPNVSSNLFAIDGAFRIFIIFL